MQEETDMETAMLVVERGDGQPGRPNLNGRLLKPLDAAEYLGVCTRQVQYLTKNGELPCIYIGTSPRYAVPDIEAFIERCRRKGGRG